MPIIKEQLNFAGWLSFVSAFVTFIVFIMTIKDVTETKSIKVLLTFISLGAFIYMFMYLRRLFNIRFKFHDVDKYISVLIWGNVFLSVLNLLSLGYSELEASLMGFLVGAFILLQIIYIIFAIRILRLPDNLFGLLRPFSYTSIAGGICLASIILIPIGFIVSSVSDIILGIIFFRAAK
ncbi:MAG: hypothetical protein OEZ31_04345 [Nitrospirota bacterium]|nr:hypothetical protein [Nitrospirota bacterium]